jgi:hypothetical protein
MQGGWVIMGMNIDFAVQAWRNRCDPARPSPAYHTGSVAKDLCPWRAFTIWRDPSFGSSMKVLSSANLYAVMCPHAVNHPSSRSTPSSPPDDLGLIYSPSVAAENNVPTVSQSESGAQGPHERIALTVVWTPSGPDRARPSSTSRNSLPPGAGPPPPSLCHAHDVHTDGHRAG